MLHHCSTFIPSAKSEAPGVLHVAVHLTAVYFGVAGVEDNGRGQNEDGLKGMTTPGFHKSGGAASEQD